MADHLLDYEPARASRSPGDNYFHDAPFFSLDI
jgi:hypothetical protein